MKRKIGLRKIAAMVLLTMMPIQTAFAGSQEVTLIIGNQKIESKIMAIAEPGYLLLPLRVVADAFGYTIQYQEKDRSITLSKVGSYIECKIGSNRVRVNGIDKTLSLVPRVIEEITYVPLQFMTACFGQITSVEDNFGNKNQWYVWVNDGAVIDGTEEITFAEKTDNYQGREAANQGLVSYLLREEGETARGIFIGSQAYHVTKAYGETSQADAGSLTYYFQYDPETEEAPKKMVFELTDGVVSSVKIYLKNEE